MSVELPGLDDSFPRQRRAKQFEIVDSESDESSDSQCAKFVAEEYAKEIPFPVEHQAAENFVSLPQDKVEVSKQDTILKEKIVVDLSDNSGKQLQPPLPEGNADADDEAEEVQREETHINKILGMSDDGQAFSVEVGSGHAHWSPADHAKPETTVNSMKPPADCDTSSNSSDIIEPSERFSSNQLQKQMPGPSVLQEPAEINHARSTSPPQKDLASVISKGTATEKVDPVPASAQPPKPPIGPKVERVLRPSLPSSSSRRLDKLYRDGQRIAAKKEKAAEVLRLEKEEKEKQEVLLVQQARSRSASVERRKVLPAAEKELSYATAAVDRWKLRRANQPRHPSPSAKVPASIFDEKNPENKKATFHPKLNSVTNEMAKERTLRELSPSDPLRRAATLSVEQRLFVDAGLRQKRHDRILVQAMEDQTALTVGNYNNSKQQRVPLPDCLEKVQNFQRWQEKRESTLKALREEQFTKDHGARFVVENVDAVVERLRSAHGKDDDLDSSESDSHFQPVVPVVSQILAEKVKREACTSWFQFLKKRLQSKSEILDVSSLTSMFPVDSPRRKTERGKQAPNEAVSKNSKASTVCKAIMVALKQQGALSRDFLTQPLFSAALQSFEGRFGPQPWSLFKPSTLVKKKASSTHTQQKKRYVSPTLLQRGFLAEDPHNRLHANATLRASIADKRQRARAEENSKRELQECTFQPKISKRAAMVKHEASWHRWNIEVDVTAEGAEDPHQMEETSTDPSEADNEEEDDIVALLEEGALEFAVDSEVMRQSSSPMDENGVSPVFSPIGHQESLVQSERSPVGVGRKRAGWPTHQDPCNEQGIVRQPTIVMGTLATNVPPTKCMPCVQQPSQESSSRETSLSQRKSTEPRATSNKATPSELLLAVAEFRPKRIRDAAVLETAGGTKGNVECMSLSHRKALAQLGRKLAANQAAEIAQLVARIRK